MLEIVRGAGDDGQRTSRRLMHMARKEVFVDLLGWEVPHDGVVEADGFDDEHAVYLILRDGGGGHLASLRLLGTDRPHLLDTVFPSLCEADPPRGPRVREVTRLCVSPRGTARDRRAARNALVDAMLDHLAAEGVETLTAVCHVGMLSQVLSAGWTCSALGLPREVGGRPAGALRIEVGPGTRDMLSPEWRHDGGGTRLRHVRELAS